MEPYELRLGKLLPPVFLPYLEGEKLDLTPLLLEQIPLEATTKSAFFEAFESYLRATKKSGVKQSRQNRLLEKRLDWTEDFIRLICRADTPHKHAHPADVLDLLEETIQLSGNIWWARHRFNDCILDALNEDTALARALEQSIVASPVWHKHVHVAGSVFADHIKGWCAQLTLEQQRAWCPYDFETAQSNALNDATQLRSGQVVPNSFLHLFAEDQDEVPWNLDNLLTPLTPSDASTLAVFYQLNWQTHNKNVSRDRYFWAWDVIDSMSMAGLEEMTPEDYVCLVQSFAEVLKYDDDTQWAFADTHLSNTLKQREDAWPALSQLASESYDVVELLRNATVPKSVTERMPKDLASVFQR